MRTIVIAILSGLFASAAQAQKKPVKFGDVTLDQLKMSRYEKDSSAEAVILVDYGESVLEYTPGNGFVINFERVTRIKILKKEGLEWANFSIPLYHSGSDDEKIKGLKAVTYNIENGKIIESKLKSDALFKEKYDANLDFTKVTLPNVKVGSVIEITYSINSDFLFNFQDWEFQETIPTVWSEYRATIPEYFNYEKYMQGYVGLVVDEHTQNSNAIVITSKERTGGQGISAVNTTFENDKLEFTETRFRWAAQNVPAFKPEPFITTSKDYITKINFELAFTKFPNTPMKNYMGTWDDINKQYYESEDFGGQVTGNGFLKKITEGITLNASSDEAKLKAICAYVKSSVLWDGTNRKFTDSSLKKVLEDKKGSSAEINLLLASMIEKAGFAVSPVLLSTRDHGFLRETSPVSSQFNYVICKVTFGEKTILLDATDRFLPFGMLPENCLNGKGFVVSKQGYSWVKLQPLTKSKIVIDANLSLQNDELSGTLRIDRVGYHALSSRKRYLSKGESDYLKAFKEISTWNVVKSEFQNVNEEQEPFKQNHEVVINDHVTSAGGTIYMNPIVLFREDENPFKAEQRDYPVDFSSPYDKTYIVKITIPEDYKVEELPQAKLITLADNGAKYIYNVALNGNIISITSMLSINHAMFTQLEYPHLREFYNLVVAKQAEQIVLKKK